MSTDLEIRAAAGDPQACVQLARKLQRGRGLPRDYERAVALLDTAARAGLPDALCAVCARENVGVLEKTVLGPAMPYQE